MKSPLLELSGAVAADRPDEEVAAHYGEPAQEQRALEAGTAFVDRSNRGVVRVSGPDRLRWLHSLFSQHLEKLPPNEPTQALLLSPNGHVEHHLHLVDDGAAVWAHVEPGTAPGLVEFLDRMRFMLRVEVADLSDEYAVVTGGPEIPGALEFPDVAGPSRIIERSALAGMPERARPAGIWAYEAFRIAAHRPRLGLDTDHRTIPHEAGWIEDAVHLDKGCYRGQETVARVHNLGRPPRRLVMLHLDGSVDRLPAHGDPVELNGRVIGFVGSAARHYELGPIALAMVKRTAPVDAELLAGGVAAAQEIVVSPDTGANAEIKLRRQPTRRA
ncbi:MULTISPECIES: CAF17-like 4Fe-4S cluster assembly/insertion protein YgfZ [Thermomonospora]|uniref:Folate-binding protein YgfZ n=1 Tax=Thermomonospora cellulosilytica TaxID=1411118 RepID=A0A7W3R816_9ACTN|nr:MULTISPECIES: glycine cleavage T C-terminal barrel domain-containing protein [Thermomonospora]MBA9003227.1 folate-binding protein YgfZ [Thermomonospora cellulosilytica]